MKILTGANRPDSGKIILEDYFEMMDIVSISLTPLKENMDWITDVTVPKDVTGLYSLLSVESKQQKLFVSHAVDITDK